MRRSARVDENQSEIVRILRMVGASVTPTHTAGSGFPDLCVGFKGVTYLLEVKDGSKPPSARKLTPAQVEWHDQWRGHCAVVCTPDEAMEAIGLGVVEW